MSFIEALGFDVTVFSTEHDPQLTDLYLAQYDNSMLGNEYSERSIESLVDQEVARFALCKTNRDILLALPPHISIEDINVRSLRDAHKQRLAPNPVLLQRSEGSPEGFDKRDFRPPQAVGALTNAEVDLLKSSITATSMEQFHARYTGQVPLNGAGLVVASRHYLHPHNEAVAEALCQHLQQIGAGVMTIPRRLDFHMGGKRISNVVAEIPGSAPESCVIVSAHFDSTARSDGPQYDPERDAAPGADDDASGVAAVLAAADAAVKLRALGQLNSTLRFVLFNAEEDRLFGSQKYVLSQMPNDVAIRGVFQMDMIGYNTGASQPEFEVHVGIFTKPQIETKSRVLADAISSVVSRVSTVLNRPQVYTTATGDPLNQHSDHTSFQSQNHPACVVTEDGNLGPLATSPRPQVNPNQHRSTDRAINYSYAAEIARVVAGAAVAMAKS